MSGRGGTPILLLLPLPLGGCGMRQFALNGVHTRRLAADGRLFC